MISSLALTAPAAWTAPAVMEATLDGLFLQLGVVSIFEPEMEIYAQDATPESVYLILDGAVRASRLLSDGRRQVGGFYYQGDVCGLAGATGRMAAAETLAPTRVASVRRSALRHYGDLGEALERRLWRATGEELSRVHDHMMLLARKSAIERVAGFLDDIAQRHDGGWTALPMPRQDIADYLGLTIETVSRMLTQLQGRRIVEFDGCRRFRISAPARLTELVAA